LTSTHSVFFGAVQAIRFGRQHAPLLHFDRHYFSLAAASIG